MRVTLNKVSLVTRLMAMLGVVVAALAVVGGTGWLASGRATASLDSTLAPMAILRVSMQAEAVDRGGHHAAGGGARFSSLDCEIHQTEAAVQDVGVSFGQLTVPVGRQADALARSSALIKQMNAAAEAAHAGQSGLGFAVVASEIRKLDESITASARSIGASLPVIVEPIDHAPTVAEETGRTFAALVERITTVVSDLDEGREATQALAVASGESLGAWERLNAENNDVRASTANDTVVQTLEGLVGLYRLPEAEAPPND